MNNYAYHSNRGISFLGTVSEFSIENIIMVENTESVHIKPNGNNHYNNIYRGTNWYISALARPNCVKCYGPELGSVGSN